MHELCKELWGDNDAEDSEWRDMGNLQEWQMVGVPVFEASI